MVLDWQLVVLDASCSISLGGLGWAFGCARGDVRDGGWWWWMVVGAGDAVVAIPPCLIGEQEGGTGGWAKGSLHTRLESEMGGVRRAHFGCTPGSGDGGNPALLHLHASD